MKGAGLTLGGFCAHFGAKQALIDTALRQSSRTLREQLSRASMTMPKLDGGIGRAPSERRLEAAARARLVRVDVRRELVARVDVRRELVAKVFSICRVLRGEAARGP